MVVVVFVFVGSCIFVLGLGCWYVVYVFFFKFVVNVVGFEVVVFIVDQLGIVFIVIKGSVFVLEFFFCCSKVFIQCKCICLEGQDVIGLFVLGLGGY